MTVENVNAHGLYKYLINLDLNKKDQDNHESSQEMTVDETLSTPTILQKVVESSDEFSSALSLLFSKKLFDNKIKGENNISEWVLEEDSIPKTDDLFLLIKNNNLSTYLLYQYSIKIFPDESDLHQVLQFFLRERELDEITLRKIKKLLNLVQDTADCKVLKGGINASKNANFFGKILQLKPGVLRASYRDFLQDNENAIDIYLDWLKLYGYKKRRYVINFLEAALLADINSLDPSCSKLEFGNLLEKCGKLKTIRSIEYIFVKTLVNNKCKSMSEDTEEKCLLMLECILQGHDDLYSRIIDFISNAYNISNPNDITYYIAKVHAAILELPEHLFIDNDWRETVLNKIIALSNYKSCFMIMDDIISQSIINDSQDK